MTTHGCNRTLEEDQDGVRTYCGQQMSENGTDVSTYCVRYKDEPAESLILDSNDPTIGVEITCEACILIRFQEESEK